MHPMTQVGAGSGFLSIENDDPTAEQQCLSFAQVGVRAADVTPWNAYPWYINRKPDAAQLDAGVEPLAQLLGLMGGLKVVLLQGGDAQNVWRRLTRKHGDLGRERHLVVIETYHPGRQALWSADPAVRRQRRENRELAYRRMADVVGAGR